MSKYLLEIGTEELPYKFIPSAIEQLKNGFKKFLEENEFLFSDINVYATPRRLAVIIDGLNTHQKDIEKEIKGPILTIAYDENGNLTPAGMGFAKKNNVSPQNLIKKDNYVFAKIEQKGKSFEEVFPQEIANIIFKMNGSHFMRWADLDVKFQRPIRWIVSILDNNELTVELAGVKSSKFSRGHRFKSDKVEINSIDNYIDILKSVNVIVNQDERKELIKNSADKTAEEMGAKVVIEEDLLEEVTHLCEFPVPVVCSFEEKYLDVPEKVVVTTMATHQRYFPLYKDGKLLNKFITMANYIGDNFENIKKGNERVVRARLDDAIFFFQDDTKEKLENKLEGLKGVTFQKGMGSMYEKTNRIIELSSFIANELNIQNTDDIKRTALLAKCDLVTKLVFEFTELQGAIGADYARISNEKENVAKGIEEHYFPLNADSELASGIEGQIVGIADKIDTICAVFADGKKPTGSADPLGVRRATLGIIKTVIKKDLNIDLLKLINKTIDLLPKQPENKGTVISDIISFFEQRLSILYGDNYSYDVIDACISEKNVLSDLKDFVKRLDIVSDLVKKDSYPKFSEAVNRVIRITKDDNNVNPINENLFNMPEEVQLYNCFSNINEEKLTYAELEEELYSSIDKISNFFDKVLVMDKDEQVKNNRLALLSFVKNKFSKIADFSKIAQK